MINLTPSPSGLYATLNTKIIERNTREKKEHSIKMERGERFVTFFYIICRDNSAL